VTVDMRVTIASAVALALKDAFTDQCGRSVEITATATTSGCPVIHFTVAGVTYNLTITRARNQ
jgi:metal-sulfur cluster biosynthetic enzyme